MQGVMDKVAGRASCSMAMAPPQAHWTPPQVRMQAARQPLILLVQGVISGSLQGSPSLMKTWRRMRRSEG